LITACSIEQRAHPLGRAGVSLIQPYEAQ
jgi:hypothetical protein